MQALCSLSSPYSGQYSEAQGTCQWNVSQGQTETAAGTEKPLFLNLSEGQTDSASAAETECVLFLI